MVANKGRKAFEGAFGEALKGKVDKPVIHPGLLGAYLDDGRPVVTVSNRPDYVWVRIRGATSEPIQAFNDTVGRHFDLPVLVARDENNPIRWKVIARDVGAYADWGGGGYLPSHGLDHSFAGAPNTGGDIAWIYKRQFMPLLPRPSDTGTKSIYVEAGYYFANGKYNWWPGSGSAGFESFQPTGAHNSKFVTVYIDPDDGILQYTAGPEFNAYEPSGTFTNFIAMPDSEQGIPIAAVYLTSGTQWINWSEIYDLRLAPLSTDVSGTVIILDDGVPLGSADRLNFSGPGFVTTISGSYAEIASEEWVEAAGYTMTGPLIIAGSVDELQLAIRANATQLENIVEVQESGGGSLLAILGDGGILQTVTTPDTGSRQINNFQTTFSGNYTSNSSAGTQFTTTITSLAPTGGREIRGVRTFIKVNTAWDQPNATVVSLENTAFMGVAGSHTGLVIGNKSIFAISDNRANINVDNSVGFRSQAYLGNQASGLVSNLKPNLVSNKLLSLIKSLCLTSVSILTSLIKSVLVLVSGIKTCLVTPSKVIGDNLVTSGVSKNPTVLPLSSVCETCTTLNTPSPG
ncbi:hypothetical protein LCGC14_0508580 [marine sediment metagenome]|uniref:Uncharacterized protein n=1 Tax=marine sediment metagenome TaxID=412755 RepID=A0A0F9S6K8_9ZZZZ